MTSVGGRRSPAGDRAAGEGDADLAVDGPNPAAQAIAAGLVAEDHLFGTASVVDGGTRFLPDGVPRSAAGCSVGGLARKARTAAY